MNSFLTVASVWDTALISLRSPRRPRSAPDHLAQVCWRWVGRSHIRELKPDRASLMYRSPERPYVICFEDRVGRRSSRVYYVDIGYLASIDSLWFIVIMMQEEEEECMVPLDFCHFIQMLAMKRPTVRLFALSLHCSSKVTRATRRGLIPDYRPWILTPPPFPLRTHIQPSIPVPLNFPGGVLALSLYHSMLSCTEEGLSRNSVQRPDYSSYALYKDLHHTHTHTLSQKAQRARRQRRADGEIRKVAVLLHASSNVQMIAKEAVWPKTKRTQPPRMLRRSSESLLGALLYRNQRIRL